MDLLPGWKFHHVGVAVRSIDDAVEEYAKLGYRFCEPIEDQAQGVRLTISTSGRTSAIELIAPLGDASPVSSILRRVGPGPYHVCYEVDSLQGALDQLDAQQLKYKVVSESKPAPLFGGLPVMFFVCPPLGVIELVERAT